MISRPIISIAVTNFGVCYFSRLAVTDWRLRRWRFSAKFLALMTVTRIVLITSSYKKKLPRRENMGKKQNQRRRKKGSILIRGSSVPL